MYRSTCCIHTFFSHCPVWHSLILRVSYFPDFFIFYYRVDLNQWPYKMCLFIWFSHPKFYIFLMGLIFTKQIKDGLEQLVFWWFLDFNIGLLATFWESRVLGAEDGRSGRQYIFVPSAFSHCQMVLSFPKLCLLSFFLLLMEIIKKLLCSFDFSTKSWTKLNNLWRNSTNTPI